MENEGLNTITNTEETKEEVQEEVQEEAQVQAPAENPEVSASAENPEVSASAEKPEISTSAEKGGNLSFDEFSQFFEKFGEDLFMDMLAKARMLSPEETKAYVAEKQYKKRRLSKATIILLIIVALEIYLLPFAINKIYMSTSINDNKPIQYTNTMDEVFCDEGHLKVNDIDVTVPADKGETYSISYSWAKKDSEYPSVPQAANVMYPDEEGNPKYEVSLYRIETVKAKSIPKGKTVDNWFDDWKQTDEDGIHQGPLKSGKLNGFYITPTTDEEGNKDSTYDTYSFYFAVESGNDIQIYVLEGICHNDEYLEEFTQIMDNGIRNLSTGKEDA